LKKPQRREKAQKGNVMARELRALGGDCFAGLFILGVKQAGFKVLGTLENCDYGAKTMRLNHPEVEQFIGKENWPDVQELEKRYLGKIDFMFTQPPCAIWSAARGGNKGSWHSDPRLSWTPNLIDAAIVIQPKAYVWESVCNAWRHGREYVLEQARRFANEGYSVTVLLQNNMYLGAPQDRPRMFMIAHKHPLVWPALTEPQTVAEALAGIKVPKKDWDNLCDDYNLYLWGQAATLKGSMRRAHDLSETSIRNGRFPCFLDRRLMGDKVAPVVLGGRASRLHHKEPRYLDPVEYLALCGMTGVDWKCHNGKKETLVRELSRSVMPPVGKWLAEAVKVGLAQRPLKKPVYQVVDMRDGPDHIRTEDLW
jgi:site-specific DNA-cytosine methylase